VLFGNLKLIPEESSSQPAKELQGKVTDILMSTPRSIFKAVFQEWKIKGLQCIEAGGDYL
jgi:hypothetical protein